MPFIHIKSLPFQQPRDVPGLIKGIAQDFAHKTSIELTHVHTTWEFFLPGHYAKGDNVPMCQPEVRHPLLVDLLTPDFNGAEIIAVMLEAIADSIWQRAAFPKDNIFINHRHAHSAMVFDDGKIVHW